MATSVNGIKACSLSLEAVLSLRAELTKQVEVNKRARDAIEETFVELKRVGKENERLLRELQTLKRGVPSVQQALSPPGDGLDRDDALQLGRVFNIQLLFE